MHSEIIIHFTDTIFFERLIRGMPASADPAAVLARTYFGDIPDVLSAVVYAHVETRVVYMVFRDAPDTVRIHVEGRASKGNLGELVANSERIAERFIGSARRRGYGIRSAVISLHAGADLITAGERRTFRNRLMSRFSETIFGDVVIGVMTFLLTGLLTGQWREALIVGAASVFCFLGWLVLEIRRGSDDYEYAGF